MGCLKLQYYPTTELKIISSKKVLTLIKSENKERSSYLFGFNGKENDNETGTQDYGMRIYDPNTCTFLSVDPLTKKYPYWTPYQFSGNMPIKYIDLDGLEPANNPDNPANQNGRNPTSTINSVYENSGGDKSFKTNFPKYMKGQYDANASVSGLTSKDGFVSDSKNDADKLNLWVNNKGVLYANEVENFDTREFGNFLLGSMINGVGAENIVFPTNGSVSNYMKGAGIVGDALNSWYSLNKGQKELNAGIAEFSGNPHMLGALIQKGPFHPESFIGSAAVKISPVSDKEIMVTIFNVTSISSGDLGKLLPWNKVGKSVVRDLNQVSTNKENHFGNISQTYSFTMPIDAARLK